MGERYSGPFSCSERYLHIMVTSYPTSTFESNFPPRLSLVKSLGGKFRKRTGIKGEVRIDAYMYYPEKGSGVSDILSRTAWRTARSPACSWSDRGRARAALGFITSETLVFPCLLIDGVVATNDSTCPQECATGARLFLKCRRLHMT